MKAPPFDYAKPRSLDEAFALLARHGGDAKLLAGGQTLLATLNMRLSEPSLLIDLNGLDTLRGIRVGAGVLRIGALVTHSEVEASPLVAEHVPLLAMAVPHIAHRAIRNLGTFGGSIAYADPAAEWPACLAALDGTVLAKSAAKGERRIAAREFFIDLYRTALADGEIVIACEVPLRKPGDLYAFDELARRHGDYAVVGLAFAGRRDGALLRAPRLAFLGCGATPVRARKTEAMLDAQALNEALLERMAQSLAAELKPPADLTHEGATKRHLACVLAKRLLAQAWAASA